MLSFTIDDAIDDQTTGAVESATYPASFIVLDSDGNPILVDQDV
jgi:hypothetical protein